MVVTPVADNIVIKLDKVEKEVKTKMGIVLSNTAAQDMPEQAYVVAVGEGRYTMDGKIIAPRIKSGDRVIFNKFAGTKITVEEDEYLIIKENDILAIIK